MDITYRNTSDLANSRPGHIRTPVQIYDKCITLYSFYKYTIFLLYYQIVLSIHVTCFIYNK